MAAVATRTQPRHWVYLDEQRTHEVHAQFALEGPAGILVTTEFPMGSREPGEMVQAQTPVRGEAELLGLLAELEGRLALTGTYFRAEADDLTWQPVKAPPPTVDLRAHEAAIPGMEATQGRMRFHHFHGEGAGKDRLLISMPRPGMTGRHVLAEMLFEFPRVDAGEINVLHARLAPPVLASAVAKEHVEAPRKGFAKLFEPRDYERAYGDGWFDKTRTMLSRAAVRLVGGPSPVPEAPVPPALGEPARLAEMRAALASQKIEALKAMYIDPVTEARLVEVGEHAIRKHVNLLRRKMSHHQSYDISMIEAILLTEYAIPAKMWDLCNEEGGKLLRYLYGYR
ncbi:MAG TPA: hypothetical protein VM370_05350 [Candidatus Thermoplasmatota archaeon]|nr:hypothetical protein [Candidatus Thermoplasmatota archaeon]